MLNFPLSSVVVPFFEDSLTETPAQGLPFESVTKPEIT